MRGKQIFATRKVNKKYMAVVTKMSCRLSKRKTPGFD